MTMHLQKASLTGSGAPTAITPDFVGQIYINETTGSKHISIGIGVGEWDSLTPKSQTIDTDAETLQSGDHERLVVASTTGLLLFNDDFEDGSFTPEWSKVGNPTIFDHGAGLAVKFNTVNDAIEKVISPIEIHPLVRWSWQRVTISGGTSSLLIKDQAGNRIIEIAFWNDGHMTQYVDGTGSLNFPTSTIYVEGQWYEMSLEDWDFDAGTVDIYVEGQSKGTLSLENSGLPYRYTLALASGGPTMIDWFSVFGNSGTKVYDLSLTKVNQLSLIGHDHDSEYLSKSNTDPFVPDSDYEPATKKYTDDLLSEIIEDGSFSNTKAWSAYKLAGISANLSLYTLGEEEHNRILQYQFTASTSNGTGDDGDRVLTTSEEWEVPLTAYAHLEDAGGSNGDVSAGSVDIKVDDVSGFSVGDEVMIHQSQTFRFADPHAAAGVYEIARIAAINSLTVTIDRGLNNEYKSDNDGAKVGNTAAQLVKIWNWSLISFATGSSIIPQNWNGRKGGILAMRSSGEILGNGEFNATSKGYSWAYQRQGEGETGKGEALLTPNGCGGGRSYGSTSKGSGGGNREAGENGASGSTGGIPFGTLDPFERLTFGGGGGATNGYNNPATYGGGIIFVSAEDASDFDSAGGVMIADGGKATTYYTGTGAGGSILFVGSPLSSITFVVDGGVPVYAVGTGGDGYITNSDEAAPPIRIYTLGPVVRDEVRVAGVADDLSISTELGVRTALEALAGISHTHAIVDVTGLQTVIDGKADTSHTHAIVDVTGLQTVIDGKAATAHSHAVAELPTTTSVRTTGALDSLLPTELAIRTELETKADTVHSHVISDVTALQTTLDGKLNTSQLSTDTDLGGVGGASDSLIPSQLAAKSYVDALGERVNGLDASDLVEDDNERVIESFFTETPHVDTKLLLMLDEELRDSTGNHVPFVSDGNGAPGTPRPVGELYSTSEKHWGTAAFSYDGSSSIEVPNHADFAFQSDFTVEAFVRVTDLSERQMMMYRVYLYSVRWAFNFRANGGIEFNFNGTNITSATGLVAAGEFAHLVAVRQGSEIRLFVNGVMVASQGSLGATLSAGTTGLVIGGNASGVWRFENGDRIDAIRISHRAVYWSNFDSATLVPFGGVAQGFAPGRKVVTSVGSPGTDDNVPTEKAIRDGLDEKATLVHNHDAAYASLGHGHDSAYLNLGNTTPFTPDTDYEPATKKYVDDAVNTYELTVPASNLTSGDDPKLIKIGTGTTVVGAFYYLNSSGVWVQTDASAEATCNGMLGLALGTNPSSDGMLLFGTFRDDSKSWTVGVPLFISATAGAITETAPSVVGEVVRIVGYALTATTMFVDPSKTWVEV